MTDPDQLPPELAALFDAERTAPTTNASGRSAIRSRLAAGLAGVPLGAAASTLGGAGKIISIVAIALAAGGGTVAIVHHASSSSATEMSAPAPAPPPAPVARPAVVVSTPDVPASPQLPPAPPRTPRPAAIREARHPSASAPAPVTEQQLVRDAWTALSADDAPRALQIVERAAQLYPAGVLDEERDAVRIVALAKLHRIDDARAAAARFANQHPTSVHRALIERALHEEDSP